MTLPLRPPVPPMEATLVRDLPRGAAWQYEPKWDGFRTLAFRDAQVVELQSKKGLPLARYFPELLAALLALHAPRFVLDGEIVLPAEGGFSFEALQLRLHPASSRIARLARERPALLVVFDLLVDETGRLLVPLPLEERRTRLEAFARRFLEPRGRVLLSPATRDLAVARGWLEASGAGTLDGVIAKRLDHPYAPGARTGVQKVKPVRTADCVVGGYRTGRGTRAVASLLLGLYDAEGALRYVGHTSALARAPRSYLESTLPRLAAASSFANGGPGGASRWGGGGGAWHPVLPRLVVEVRFDHVTGGRFRHATTLLRLRPDKDPGACTLEQLAPPRPSRRRPRARAS